LHDGGELGGAIGPDHLAERNQTRRDDAVEGRLDLRVAEVERGLRGIDLRLFEPGARRIAIGRCIVERLLRGDLAAREVGLSYSDSVCFNVACAATSAARARSSLSLYGSGSMTKSVAPSFTSSPSL
jgi:hypothetical protein